MKPVGVVIAFGLTPLQIRKSTTGARTRWKPDLASWSKAMKGKAR